MKIVINKNPKIETDCLIIPIPNGVGAAFERVAKSMNMEAAQIEHDFKAEAGEILTLYKDGKRIILLGLGQKNTPAELARCFRILSHKHPNKLSTQLAISFLHDNTNGNEQLFNSIEASITGLVLGTYQIGKFKSSQVEDDPHPLKAEAASVTILTDADPEQAQAAAAKGKVLAETQMSIFDLVNAPSNKKTPQHLAEWALQSGQQYGFKVTAMDKSQIEELGLHALLAVNQGSPTPPYFIVMEYQPKGQAVRKVGMVGKGVTFDTGGVSIKPSSNMHFMKSDMGGAAAVLGTMEATARLELPVHLIGIVPTTDNSVDAEAVKPGDVIDSYSGKTIEVIDTDAEGRLILADGLDYMVKHYQPDVLIDLATLTGSAVRTFGYHAGALFSNDDELAEQIFQSGNRTGERVWRLPIWDVYKEDLKSDVADVRNYSGRPMAGAIGAAKFLETFIGGHPHWAHMDIAGVAFNDMEFSIQKSATGFGIRLLIDYLSGL